MKKPSMTAGTKAHRTAVAMKKESMARLKRSMAKKLDIEVTRGDDEIMFDKDRGTETGQTRSKKVRDAMKFEEYNKKITARNKAKNQKELDKMFREVEDMADGKRPFDQKRFDEIGARQKAIKEGDFEGGEKLYKVKYSGEDLKQRKLAEKNKYTYERGKSADVYDLKNKNIPGKGGGYEESTNKEIREGRTKRKEAIEKESTSKMKKPAVKLKKDPKRPPKPKNPGLDLEGKDNRYTRGESKTAIGPNTKLKKFDKKLMEKPKPSNKKKKEDMATALEKGLKKRNEEMKGKTHGTGAILTKPKKKRARVEKKVEKKPGAEKPITKMKKPAVKLKHKNK